MSEPSAQEKKEQRLRLLDDEIGRKLAEAQQSGELRAAPSYGKPLNLGDGYAETPDDLKMPMKILKDAGVVPAEVEAMREIAARRVALPAVAPLGDELEHGVAEQASGVVVAGLAGQGERGRAQGGFVREGSLHQGDLWSGNGGGGTGVR